MKDLFLEELASTCNSGHVRTWYASYINNVHPTSAFARVLALLGHTDGIDVLAAAASLFEAAQQAADSMSILPVHPSYSTSMDIISMFTLHSAAFPIMERHLPASIRDTAVDIYNEATFHLNAPRDPESQDILEARRRFFFDLYLPLQIHHRGTMPLLALEQDFVRMYITRQPLTLSESPDIAQVLDFLTDLYSTSF